MIQGVSTNAISLALFVVLLFVLPTYALAHIMQAGASVIHISDRGFVPDEITIHVGDTIVFENEGKEDHWPASNLHPTHTIYPEFDPKRPITSGKEWSFTFEKSGKWVFHDHLYPQFFGHITVLPVGEEMSATSPSAPSALTAWIAGFWDSVKNTWGKFVSLFHTRAQSSRTRSSAQESTKADLGALYEQMPFSCEHNDFFCVADVLKKITRENGPSAAVAVYERLRTDGKVDPAVDEHQLAHQIGRATAEAFGAGTEAFLLCPMSALNGGCQHGFFEYVLGKTKTTSEAADQVCGALKNGSYSPKQQFDCYHGVGHGIMMAQAYDLDASLRDCDALPDGQGVTGCWQGVFMENVNGGMTGQARDGVFSTKDPLAPCNGLAEKYRHECYINHAGWLMTAFRGNIGRATHACLKAEAKKSINACLQSIGLMVTNPSWQLTLGPQNNGSFEGNAWNMCLQFPVEYRDQCVIGAVDNLMNFNTLDTTRAKAFCDFVPEEFEPVCLRTIDVNIGRQSPGAAQ